MDALNKKFHIFDILMFISILFIGTDIWAINIGVNIRLIQVFYIGFVALLIIDGRYKLYFNIPLLFFVSSASISTIFSISFKESFVYYLWIIYDLVFLIPIFYFYLNEYGPSRLFKIFRLVFVCIFCLIIFQFVIDTFFGIELPIFSCQHHLGITRPALWFYEPSYLASFLLIYFAILTYKIFVYKEFELIIEYCLMAFALVLVTSTTGFIGLALCLGFGMVAFVKNLKNLEWQIYAVIGFIFLAILGISLLYLIFPNVVNVFIMRLFRDGISESSGTRVSEYKYQIECFLRYPIFGAGLDCYGSFRQNSSIEASNISLELLACSGLVGFCAFYIFVLFPVYKAFVSKTRNNYKYGKIFSFSLLVLIIILQANQNYMRLYLWMMIIVSYVSIIYEDKQALEVKGIDSNDN